MIELLRALKNFLYSSPAYVQILHFVVVVVSFFSYQKSIRRCIFTDFKARTDCKIPINRYQFPRCLLFVEMCPKTKRFSLR